MAHFKFRILQIINIVSTFQPSNYRSIDINDNKIDINVLTQPKHSQFSSERIQSKKKLIIIAVAVATAVTTLKRDHSIVETILAEAIAFFSR